MTSRIRHPLTITCLAAVLLVSASPAYCLLMRDGQGPEPVIVQLKEAARKSDTIDIDLGRLHSIETSSGVAVVQRWVGRKYVEEISFPATFTESKALSVIAALQQLSSVEKVVAVSAANLEFDPADFSNRYAASDLIPDSVKRGFDTNPVPRRTYSRASELGPHVRNRIIVRWKEQFVFKAAATGFLQRFADFHATAGCRVISELENSEKGLTLVLQFDPARSSVLDQVLRYQACPWVDYAEPDYINQVTATPNDPLYTSGHQWNMTKISAPSAWDITRGSPGVVLAIADTGANIAHPDFAANLWSGQNNGDIHNFADNSTNVYDNSSDHHGSVVASIVGAQGNNGLYMTGVNWDVSLMHLKISDTGQNISNSVAIRAVTYAYTHGASAVNCSFGYYDNVCHKDGEDTICDHIIDPAYLTAMRNARNANTVAVCAAGNGDPLTFHGVNTDIALFSPADAPTDNVISVANTDQNDVLAVDSNWGQKTVDLSAPGVNIYGLKPTYNGNSLDLSNYFVGSGTSASAPHVTGAIGLVKARYPWEDYYGLRDRILMSTDTISTPGKPLRTSGRLNATRALHRRTVVHNFSTRARVENGDRILIMGFSIGHSVSGKDSGTGTLKIAIRAIGPDLPVSGVTLLNNPTLRLNNSAGQQIYANSDWQTLPAGQQADLSANGLTPGDPRDAAMVVTLGPGSYTAFLESQDGSFGVALCQIYELESGLDEQTRLLNVSSRCFVGTGNEIAIGGASLGTSDQFNDPSVPKRSILFRGIGPSLANYGVQGVLANPYLQVFNSAGTLLQTNDSWANMPAPTDELIEANKAPANPAEAGLWPILSAGAYTAQLSGVGGGTGIGLLELYEY
jgi:subtilisin family serine protease